MKPNLPKITIIKDGPYLVSGGLPLYRERIGTNTAGESIHWEKMETLPQQDQYALCRCGHSNNKPFCDGSHLRTGFDGTETANRHLHHEQADTFDGPALSLADAKSLCSFARFCDTHGTVWKLVHQTDDARIRELFLEQVCACPSGRLVAYDNRTGEPIEPNHNPSISLIEDPAKGCAGPLWVRGGVQIVAGDGFEYEVRNRITLCRCGASANKPFCDGTHVSIQFRDT